MEIRYTSWTGTERPRLAPDRLFEELGRHLGATDDIDEALDRLAREGFEGAGIDLMGVDELLEAIRNRARDLSSRYNFDRVFDHHRRRIDELLAKERASVARSTDAERRRRDEMFLARVPAAVRDAIDRLAHHEFADGVARSKFDDLLNERDDIDRVSAFVERHGRTFRGSEALTFDEALELVTELDALREIEEALFRRDFTSIDTELVESLLGGRASRAMVALRELVATLTGAGLVVRKGQKLMLSPKGARRLGEMALREIHRQLRFDSAGSHDVDRQGPSDVDHGGTRRYRFGDASQLAAVETIGQALRRGGPGRLGLVPEDLTVYESTRGTRSATVLLLDMSWSMSWEGRFAAAKKVALAMQTLMRTRYPRDYFAVVGFYTRAVRLDGDELPEATWNMGDPFTNLQDGLRLGSELLDRERGRNKNMIVVTDGQPTAYFVGGRLFCEWPMSLGGLSTRATVETLREVERVTRKGIRINTFMLDDSPPLRAFVEKMTSINRGRAFYTTPDELGKFVLSDHVARRRKIV